MEENKSNGTGFGVASLVTGILSIIFIPFIIISLGFGIMAIIFGVISLKKGNKGKAGLILGIVSLAITFLLFLFLDVLDVSLFIIPSWYK